MRVGRGRVVNSSEEMYDKKCERLKIDKVTSAVLRENLARNANSRRANGEENKLFCSM